MASQPTSKIENIDSNSEIDFLAFFEKIWTDRKFISIFILVSAISALILIKLVPSYYRIDATIDSVPGDQLRPLFPSVLDSREYQVPSPDERKIYNRVLLQIGSLALLRSFWEKHTGKILPLEENITSTDEGQAFRDFVDDFTLEPPNPKAGDVTARKITLEDTKRSQGIALLNEYLNFVAQQVWQEQVKQMEASYESSLSALAVNYNNKVLVEERRLSDSLINLQESLKLAQSMGIKDTPFKELENIQLKVMDSRDYLLGTKSLSSQIEMLIARQGKSLAPYSPELRHMETWREQMTSDMKRLKELEGKLKLFAVVNPPEASLNPIRPKKGLIFIAVLFLSGLLSVSIVLIRGAVQERKQKSK